MHDRRQSWLVISYFSMIEGNGQSFWIDDRLSHLRKKVRVRLISSIRGERHKDLPHMRVMSLAPSGIKSEMSAVLKRRGFRGMWLTAALLPLWPLVLLERLVLRIGTESRWSWSPTAALVGILMCLRERPSLLYSTGGPVSAHMAAATIAWVTKVSWIAELQDPLVYPCVGSNALSRRALGHIEDIIFRQASKVVFCTKRAAEDAEQRHMSGKAAVIYPGAPAETMPEDEYAPGTVCTFGHFGSLYQTRNVARFLDALELVFADRPDLAKSIRLELYGGVYTQNVSDRIRSFPYPDVIRVGGMIPRYEAIRKASRCDVLLLIQNTDMRSAATMPAKVYEYLALRRPILGLVYNNEELQTILETHGHQVVSADSAEHIKEAILSFHRRWQEDQLGCEQYPETELTVERASQQLLDLAEATIRAAPAHSVA